MAVRELVGNAVEHNDDRPPSVDVVVDAGEATVSIRVVDNGPRIPSMEYSVLDDDAPIEPTVTPPDSACGSSTGW